MYIAWDECCQSHEGRQPMYRINLDEQQQVFVAASISAIGQVLRTAKPGRYRVEEISADPPAEGSTTKRWGTVTKGHDQSVVIEPDPW